MRGVPAMDVTALRSLRNIHAVCKRHGAVMILSHVNEQPMSVMEHAGLQMRLEEIISVPTLMQLLSMLKIL